MADKLDLTGFAEESTAHLHTADHWSSVTSMLTTSLPCHFAAALVCILRASW